MKKWVIIVSAVLVFLAGILTAAPMLFRNPIIRAINETLEESLKAKVYFEDVDLSFWRAFPNLGVTMEKGYIAGIGAFKGDTLLQVQSLTGELSLSSLFSDEGYEVKGITVVHPKVCLHRLKDGRANWDIVREEEYREEKESKPFRLQLNELRIKEGFLFFNDEQNRMQLRIDTLNHRLRGNLDEEETDLITENNWQGVTVASGNVTWLNRAKVELQMCVNQNRKEGRYTLSENHLKVNEVEMYVEGWLDVNEDIDSQYDMNIRLRSPQTDFKDVLSLIPAIYANRFGEIETGGKVTLDGYVKGTYNGGEKVQYPSFALMLNIVDAWFRYPSLPRKVENIQLDGAISNKGGNTLQTEVKVSRFNMNMGGNPLSGRLDIRNLNDDPDIDAELKGALNLGTVKDFYPLQQNERLQGSARVNLNIKGKLSYYDKGWYDRFRFNGDLALERVTASLKTLPHPIAIDRAKLVFTSRSVEVPYFDMRIGKSDLALKGNVDEVVGHLLRGDTLRGRLTGVSDYVDLADLLSGEQQTESSDETQVLILPEDLSLRLNASFRKLVYEKIEVSDARGLFVLSSGVLEMNGVSLSTMGGRMTCTGLYASPDAGRPPRGKASLTIRDVLYSEVYRQVESAKEIVPVFEGTTGRFSGDVDFSVDFGSEMNPDLQTLNAVGVISSENITVSGVESLHRLSKTLKKPELYEPLIPSVSIPFRIMNGNVYTENFGFSVSQYQLKIDKGRTGLDKSVDYVMHLDVPTSESTVFKVERVGVHITGSIDDPKVKIQTREMLEDAARTMGHHASSTMKAAGEDMKQEWREQKEEMRENLSNSGAEMKTGLKEAGQEIKKGLRDLFHSKKESEE